MGLPATAVLAGLPFGADHAGAGVIAADAGERIAVAAIGARLGALGRHTGGATVGLFVADLTFRTSRVAGWFAIAVDAERATGADHILATLHADGRGPVGARLANLARWTGARLARVVDTGSVMAVLIAALAEGEITAVVDASTRIRPKLGADFAGGASYVETGLPAAVLAFAQADGRLEAARRIGARWGALHLILCIFDRLL